MEHYYHNRKSAMKAFNRQAGSILPKFINWRDMEDAHQYPVDKVYRKNFKTMVVVSGHHHISLPQEVILTKAQWASITHPGANFAIIRTQYGVQLKSLDWDADEFDAE